MLFCPLSNIPIPFWLPSRARHRVQRRAPQACADMAETMYAAPGVGLAANQVGSLKRIVVIDITDEKNNLLVLVNPYIKSHTEELAEFEEGCLSLKGLL